MIRIILEIMTVHRLSSYATCFTKSEGSVPFSVLGYLLWKWFDNHSNFIYCYTDSLMPNVMRVTY